MAQSKVAKLFRNGASQAVRLPIEFRFDGTEVYVSRDEITGDVIRSSHPGDAAWAEFFRLQEAMDESEILADFMADRPMNRPPLDREIFAAGANREDEL
jgi:antitoxin VapB